MIGFKPGEVEKVGQGFEAMGSREPRQFLRQRGDVKRGSAGWFPHLPPLFLIEPRQLPPPLTAILSLAAAPSY